MSPMDRTLRSEMAINFKISLANIQATKFQQNANKQHPNETPIMIDVSNGQNTEIRNGNKFQIITGKRIGHNVLI